MKPVKWMGPVPEKCQLSGLVITNEFVDGVVRGGRWGILHPDIHLTHGFGIGPGCGQRYKKQKNGDWLKVEG